MMRDGLMSSLGGWGETVVEVKDTFLVALLLEEVVEAGGRQAPKQLTLPSSYLTVGEDRHQSHGLASVDG